VLKNQTRYLFKWVILDIPVSFMRISRLSKEEIRKKYDSFSKMYDYSEIFFNLFIGRARRKMISKASGKVLEIGIGTGSNIKYYPYNCTLTGIDLSEGMLNIARRKAEKLGKKLNLIKGDAENLPFKNGEFDYVIDTLGLCTYPDPIKALKEMKRVCRKSGRILLLEHGASNSKFVRRLQARRESKQYSLIGCHLMRNPEELVGKAGFKIASCERKFSGIFYIIEAGV